MKSKVILILSLLIMVTLLCVADTILCMETPSFVIWMITSLVYSCDIIISIFFVSSLRSYFRTKKGENHHV